MVMKKTIVFSLVIALVLFGYINSYYPGDVLTSMSGASLDITPTGKSASFLPAVTFGNLVVYLVVAGAVYLFMRSVVKRFGY